MFALRDFVLEMVNIMKKIFVYFKVMIFIAVTSASPSPGPMKMTPRMTTLHEENTREAAPLLHMEEEEEEDEEDEHSEFDQEEQEVRKTLQVKIYICPFK